MQIKRPSLGFLTLTDVRALEAQPPKLAPWEVEPYRLWSLWDIMLFHNAAFVAAWGEFNRIVGGPGLESEQFVEEVAKAFDGLSQEVARSKLPLSHGTRDHFRLMKMDLDSPSPNIAVLMTEARSIHNGLLGDLEQHAFVRIAPNRKELYQQKEPPFGAIVEERFPDSTRDVAAASRCLALGEWTACVFHLMRALEQTLHVLA